jgi:hypothetical protein
MRRIKLKFKTVSGSLYEINTDSKKIRRVSGTTETVRATNNWKEYDSLIPDTPIVGKQLYIWWNTKNTPLLAGSKEGSVPVTITSIVSEIVKEGY